MPSLGDFYDAKSAAAEIGIEYKTLLQRIARSKVKHHCLGRMKLISTAEVERLKELEKKKGQLA